MTDKTAYPDSPYADLDEHTQTTLVRVARGLPVPAAELDRTALVLVARFTDPSREENWLKRPATRTCIHCGGTWRTRLSLLCCSAYCSPACEAASRRLLEESERWIRTLRAWLGILVLSRSLPP